MTATPTQSVWVVRAGRAGRYAKQFQAQRLVALPAWGVPDLAGLTRQ
jgi:hypothetical protein